jgi:DNA mismatch repair protein MutS
VTPASGPSEVEKALDAITVDDLTPRAALDALYSLKQLRSETKKNS